MIQPIRETTVSIQFCCCRGERCIRRPNGVATNETDKRQKIVIKWSKHSQRATEGKRKIVVFGVRMAKLKIQIKSFRSTFDPVRRSNGLKMSDRVFCFAASVFVWWFVSRQFRIRRFGCLAKRVFEFGVSATRNQSAFAHFVLQNPSANTFFAFDCNFIQCIALLNRIDGETKFQWPNQMNSNLRRMKKCFQIARKLQSEFKCLRWLATVGATAENREIILHAKPRIEEEKNVRTGMPCRTMHILAYAFSTLIVHATSDTLYRDAHP